MLFGRTLLIFVYGYSHIGILLLQYVETVHYDIGKFGLKFALFNLKKTYVCNYIYNDFLVYKMLNIKS